MEKGSISYYLEMLKKRWWIILLSAFIVSASALITSLISPKIYQAKTTIYALQTFPSLSLPSLPSAVSSLGQSSSYYLVVLLESETLAARVADELHLSKNKLFVGEAKGKITKEGVIKRLKSCTQIKDDTQGKISVIVSSEDAQLSANIANQYIKALEGSIFTVAKENRLFLEEQLKKVKKELSLAEDSLRRFEEKNKTIALSRETEEEIVALASLQSQQTANKIALLQTDTLLKVGGSIPDLVKLELDKAGLKAKENGLDKAILELKKRLTSLPATSQALARLMRKVKLEESLYEMLTQQYEMAKISEQKENVKFQVIDQANPQEKPIKPRKRLNTLVGMLVGLMIGLSLALMVEYKPTKPNQVEFVEAGL